MEDAVQREVDDTVVVGGSLSFGSEFRNGATSSSFILCPSAGIGYMGLALAVSSR